jgi:hypothetical protein
VKDAEAKPATKAPSPEEKAAAPAESTGPKDIPAAVETAKSVFASFKGGKWRGAIAGCIMLLVFLWRRYLGKLIIGKLSSWWVGFVTVLLGYIASIPEALVAEPFGWWTFMWSGLATSAEAMLLWQMMGKRLLPKVFGKPESAEE